MCSWPPVRIIAVTAFSLFFILSALPARGDEAYYSGEPKLRVGGSGNVSLLKTSIRIENFSVNVKYAFKAQGKRKSSLVFALDAPSFDNRVENSTYPDRSYADLIMSLDGKRVQYKRKTLAFVNGQNITQDLDSLGFKPNDISSFNVALANTTGAPAEIIGRLRSKGYVNGDGRPLWTAKNDYEFQMEVAPRATVLYQYVYRALPGIFYVGPEDTERREVVRLVGTPWSTLQKAFGGASGIQGYNILRVMQLPLWAESWKQPPDQLDIHVAMSPVGDKDCLLVLILDGQTYSGEGSLRLILNRYNIKGPVWLAVYSPFGVH